MKKPVILLCIAFACSFQAQGQTITTIAGNGVYGHTGDGGPATDAEIYDIGILVDSVGDVYFGGGRQVRKVDTDGTISNAAGNAIVNAYAGDGYPATAAYLWQAEYITFAADGSLYISDAEASVIRKVSTDGIISTIVGGGYGGFSGDGGPATSAIIYDPAGIVTDGSGNIYFADQVNNRIRKIDDAGIISTIAGNGVYGYYIDGGLATAAELAYPTGLARDASGNLFFADRANNRIRKIDVTGIITTVAGNGMAGYSGDGGPATAAEFNNPWGVFVDSSENIYIADTYNNRLRKINTAGIVTTIAGNGIGGYNGDGVAPALAELYGPTDVTVDKNGKIYIADASNSRVRVICSGSPATMPVSGSSGICTGASIMLSDSTAGGQWQSSNTTIATVDNTGTVTGIALGTATISYSAFNNCGTAVATKIVTVNPLPSAGTITAIAAICPGTAYALTDAATGGLWTSSNAGIATIGSAGVVHGVAGGIDTISYTVANSCSTAVATALVTVNPSTLAGTITGTPLVCAGSITSLSNAATGGSWTSSTTSIATVSGGSVTGIAAGTSIITYSVSGPCGAAAATMHITVNPLPFAGTIIGTPTVCAISVAAFADATTGGTWSSSATGIATVTSYGFVTGITGGMDTISYSVTNSCGTVAAIKPVTIIPLAVAGAITGPSAVCTGATISLSDIITGGAWSNSFTAIATISGAGMVTGVMPGVDTLFYTVTTGCSAATVKKTVTVNPLPTVGAITGTASVCAGSSTSLSDAVTGGLWSSSNTAIATVGSTGTAYGVSADTVTISYAVTNSCGTAAAVKLLTVNPLPIAGIIIGTASIAAGICPGATASLSDTATGGAWSSANTSASVAVGLVTGFIAGIDTISYSVSNSCGVATATLTITVDPLPAAGTISGPPNVCAGALITLTDAATGGVWSSPAAAIVIGSASGIVTGISAGTAIVSYSVTNICATAMVTTVVTIDPLPVVAAITGVDSVCLGDSIMLSDAVTGGAWAAILGNSTVSTLGVVTGIIPGTDTISYTISTATCGSALAVFPVNILSAGECNTGVAPSPSTGSAQAAAVFRLYPNPTSGSFTVEASAGAGEILIYNIEGECVSTYKIQDRTTALQLPAGISQGIYICKYVPGEGGIAPAMVRLVYAP